MSAALGVDLGATWLRACLAEDGREVWDARVPAADWRLLPAVLSRLLRSRRAPRLKALTVGSTRIGGREGRAALTKALRPLAARVRVLPDFETAHLAAFGRGPGVVLGAGTGSYAFARGLGGRAKRAGGYGPLHGDEGSGFWLGREAARDEKLRRALRLPRPLDLAHAGDPVRATAALAPRVLRGSRRLREAAAQHLAALALEAARGLRLPKPAPLRLHGSLFKNDALRRAVLRRLGSDWRAVEPRVSPERAAAGL
jgi:glucosamine kinase